MSCVKGVSNMALNRTFAAVAIFSSLAVASPAFAQARGRDHGGRSDGGSRGGQHVERSAAPRSAPSAPSRSYSGPARTYSGPSRSYAGPSRSYNGPVAGSRYAAPRVYASRGYSPRVYASPRVYGPRGYAPSYRSYGYRSYGYGGYGYRPYVYRPYAFRPHFSIGFGFFAGYAVPYSWDYPTYYPYASPYPAPYGYPTTGYPPEYYESNSVNVTPGPSNVAPGPSNSGGVSFEVNPAEAQVFVDGRYVGVAQSFDGTKQPLTLPAGQHRVELRAEGYQVVTFDVNVLAGQVIPYRGDMTQGGVN
jgi:hypothetical protein